MNDAYARALLESAASGNRHAMSGLYDLFATDTYSVCAHYVQDDEGRADAMARLWLHVWEIAPRLASMGGSVRTALLSIAHSRASTGATRSPLALA